MKLTLEFDFDNELLEKVDINREIYYKIKDDSNLKEAVTNIIAAEICNNCWQEHDENCKKSKKYIEKNRNTKYIYYIENTVNERSSHISGYFLSEKEAIIHLSSCQDWYNKRGTGRIYRAEVGLYKNPVLIHEKLF